MRIIKNNKVIQIDDIFNSNENNCNIITCTETEYNTLKKENKLDNEKTYLIYTDNISSESENTYKEEVLFYGYASTKGTYELSSDIHDFDYIEVYATSCGALDSTYSENIIMEKIKVSDIDIYEEKISINSSALLVLDVYASSSYYYCIRLRLVNNKLILISIGATGWGNCGVYKVVGIKH